MIYHHALCQLIVFSCFECLIKILYFSPAKLDPPVVTITRVNASLRVRLRPPELPHRNQTGKNTSMENYYNLVYRVSIINNSLEKEQKAYEGTQRAVEIQGLTPHCSYCVVAEMYQPMFDRRSPRSKERCVQIP